MKISAKSRYALAAAVEIAQRTGVKEDYVSTISISKSLGISKIFLEQAMSHLKNGELIISAKGANGGYRLSRPAEQVTVWDLLATIETSLFEKTENTVLDNSPAIEGALRELVFDKLDMAIKLSLEQVTLQDLIDASNCGNEEQSFMLNI